MTPANQQRKKKKKIWEDLRAELNHCLVTAYKHIREVAVFSFSQPDHLPWRPYMQNIQTSLNHLLRNTTEWVIFKTKPFDFQTTFGQTCGNEEKLLPENWTFMQCTWFATASMGSWVNINSNSPWQKGSLNRVKAGIRVRVLELGLGFKGSSCARRPKIDVGMSWGILIKKQVVLCL